VPDKRLPKATKSIHYSTPDFGSLYTTYGLYGLMTISKYEAEYREVVRELASQILGVAENCHLEPGPVADYYSIRNAFELAGQENKESDQ
jgi:hypothetical protein